VVQAWYAARVVAITGETHQAKAEFERICAIPLGKPHADGAAVLGETEHHARVRDHDAQRLVLAASCSTLSSLKMGMTYAGREQNDVGGQLSWSQMKEGLNEQLATVEAMDARPFSLSGLLSSPFPFGPFGSFGSVLFCFSSISYRCESG
jgi:hypothetical protein